MEEAPHAVAGKDWKPAEFPPLPVFVSSRRALVDPSVFSTALYSARIKRLNVSRAITLLEDVIDVLIRHMWHAHQQFDFWNLLSEGSVAQRLSFFAFKRGPLHLGATAYAALRNCTVVNPYRHILNSATNMISAKLSVFKTIQSSLALFLSEAYYELISYEGKIDEDPVILLQNLSMFLENSFRKLEISLRNTGDSALLDQALYDADLVIDDKIVLLDSFLSSLIDPHKKPDHFTMNWMLYTCGVVTVAGCSLWLLRHRSMVEKYAAHSWSDVKVAAVHFWENLIKNPVSIIAKEISSASENLKEASGKKDLFEKDYNIWRKLSPNACAQNIRTRVCRALCLFYPAGYMLHCRSLYSFFETNNVAMQGINQSDDVLMTRLNEICSEQIGSSFMNFITGQVGQALLIQVQKCVLNGRDLFVQVNELIVQNRVMVAAFASVLLLLPRFGLDQLAILWRYNQRHKAEAMAIAHEKRKGSLYEDIKERISRIQELTMSVESEFLIPEEAGLLIYAIAMLHVQAAPLLADTGDVMSFEENMRTILRPGSGYERQLASAVELYNLMMGHASPTTANTCAVRLSARFDSF